MQGCCVLNERSECIYANDTFVEYVRRKRPEVIGRELKDILPGTANDSLVHIVRRCLRDRAADHFESECVFAEGDSRWFDFWVQPIAAGVVVLCYDITPRKTTETALRDSERHYRELFEDAPIGYHEISRKGVITRINTTEARLLGYRADEMIGHPVWDFIADRDESERAVKAKLKGERPLREFERRYVRKDGSVIDLFIQEHYIRDAGGAIVGIRSVVHEITRRKKAERALRESQRALVTLMRNLPGMAYRCRNDNKWTMEFVSEGCFDLTGRPPEDLINNRVISYAELIHVDDRASVWEGVQAALKKDKPFRLQYRIITERGEERWVWEQGRGVETPDGRILALEGFIFDITDRIRADEALRRSEQRYRDLARRFEHEASHDALTGCYNRRSMRNILANEAARARRHGRSLSLALVDVDLMKQVNDSMGHDVGDAVLCRLVEIITRAKRAADSLARWGGDEFVIIMPDTSAEQAEAAMQRIAETFRTSVKELPGLPPKLADLDIGVSCGVVEYQAEETVTDFLRRADELMYADKRRKK